MAVFLYIQLITLHFALGVGGETRPFEIVQYSCAKFVNAYCLFYNVCHSYVSRTAVKSIKYKFDLFLNGLGP